MSKNRNVRNAKRIRATIVRDVPFQQSHLKVGEVVQYSRWLFALTNSGVLVTDLGCGIERLRHYYKSFGPVCHDHWFVPHRVATRRPDLKL